MKGDENKLFDEFLRNSLANYQVPPSPGVWSALKFKLFSRNIWHTSFFHGNAGLIGSVSTGIIVTGLTTWYMVGKVDNRIVAQDTSTQKQISVMHNNTFQSDSTPKEQIALTSLLMPKELKLNSVSISDEFRSSSLPKTKQTTDDDIDNATATSTYTKNKSIIRTPVTKELLKPDHQLSNSKIVNKTANSNTSGNFSESGINSSYFEPLLTISGKSHPVFLASTDNLTINTNPLTICSLSKDELFLLLKKDLRSRYDYARSTNMEWSAGLAASPEWLLNNSDNEFGKNNIVTSLFVRAKRQHFFIETGISIYKEKTVNKHNINYFPFLGSYRNLDSVTFVYNPNTGPVPTYYYHDIRIYDSIERHGEVSKNAYYTFAGIPVLVGFAYDFGRHGFTVKTGPIFSYMISKNVPTPEFDPQNHDKIIKSVNALNIRNKLNIQWKLEFNYQYAILRKLNIFFGPYYTTMISQPYERKKLNSGLPAYFGTKAGIMWNF